MKILVSESRKDMYRWGLDQGYKVAGVYVAFNGIDSNLQGSCEVTVDTTIFDINDTMYEIEKITLPSGRVKKTIKKF